MRLRLILSTVLLLSVGIILSSSSSEHRLEKRHSRRKVCRPFRLPYNAEWLTGRGYYFTRCKGTFQCSYGFQMKVRTVCLLGRWKVKIFCDKKPMTTTPTTTTTTSTTTTTPTTSNTTPTTSNTTPTTTTTTPTTTTTTDPGIQCDPNPMVENGVITSETISTEVGSTVQFNCSAGFTLNGRVGQLTCNSEGNFVQDIECVDCRTQDQSVSRVFFDDEVEASDQVECDQLCAVEEDCLNAQFTQPDTCKFNFTITQFAVLPGSVEFCRQACYDNSRCEAFLAPSITATLFPECFLYTRGFPVQIIPGFDNIFSTCV